MKQFFNSLLYSLFIAAVTADPLPANLKVFCFRITDIREDCSIPNRFYFEFEVLNWADAFVGGIQISIAHGSDQELTFVEEFDYNGIDQDGRPLILEDVNGDGAINNADMEDGNGNGQLDVGEDKNNNERLDNDPAPGNLPTNNQWKRKSASESTIIWEMASDKAISFINLFDTNGLPTCIPNTMGRTVHNDGSISPTEAIDNGVNVKDGFVMTIDGFEAGMTAHLNWFLLGAGENTSNLQTGVPNECISSSNPKVPLGDTLGNPMGNGMVSIARVDGHSFPSPEYMQQSGYAQTTRDFFDSSYNVPNCPDPNNPNDQPNTRKHAEFALEFSPSIFANFCIGDDAPNGIGDASASPIGNVNTRCGGDPHFKTWSGKHFDYQGECDLVLAYLPNFQNGVGLTVHVRTRNEGFYSIVSGAAFRVGNAIFEFDHQNIGKPEFYVDGVAIPELPFEDEYFHVSFVTIVSETFGQVVDIYEVSLGNGSSINIEVMGMWAMLNINVKGQDAKGSTGLSGNFPAGKMYARDGKTNLGGDHNAYGSEWQVQEDEPKLFRSIPNGHPQAPHDTCRLPKGDAHQYFRVNKREMWIKALRVCRSLKLSKEELRDCVFDVTVMENVEIARAWWGNKRLSSTA